MSDIVSPLLQWLNTHPELSGIVTFIISAGESVAIVGTIIPGSIMMTALGMLAGAGVIPLWPTLFWAILGAIVGDGISYWIGYYFKDRLTSLWPFRKHPGILEKGEAFFNKYGSMSVFIGRFVGPVRALVPLVAGMLGMRPWQFSIANITSAIGWAPAYMLPGILLGAASLELPPDIAVHVMLVLLLIILFILLCLWFIYKLYQLIQSQINQLQDNIWNWLKKSRLSTLTKLLKDANPKQTHGQLNLVFYFLFTSFLFVCLVCWIQWDGGANRLGINQTIFHFFRGIRNNYTDYTDNIMLAFTLLGQKQVIMPLIFTLFVWLMISRRSRPAWHVVALGILAAGSIYVLKKAIHSLRPWGILHSPETYSMPSGHTVLSTTIYLGLIFLLTRSIASKRIRQCIFAAGLILLFIIGISRLYLGAHWLTDVLSGWLLGLAIIIFVLISYQREPEKPIAPLALGLVSLVTLIVTYSLFSYLQFSQLQSDYTEIDWPTIYINEHYWWKKNDVLKVTRTSLFGFPTQAINIEWVGQFDDIKSTLAKNGWNKAPTRDLISTLHRIADVRSSLYLPMVSPQYLDKRPDLVLTQAFDQEKNLIVLRLWKSQFIMKNASLPLWVGTIGIIPTTYSWLPHKKRDNLIEIDNITAPYLFANHIDLDKWQQKMLIIQHLTRKNKRWFRRVILLRENRP